jgi:hypothetical protein
LLISRCLEILDFARKLGTSVISSRSEGFDFHPDGLLKC